jgi:hypothetical protein
VRVQQSARKDSRAELLRSHSRNAIAFAECDRIRGMRSRSWWENGVLSFGTLRERHAGRPGRQKTQSAGWRDKRSLRGCLFGSAGTEKTIARRVHRTTVGRPASAALSSWTGALNPKVDVALRTSRGLHADRSRWPSQHGDCADCDAPTLEERGGRTGRGQRCDLRLGVAVPERSSYRGLGAPPLVPG